MAKVIAHQIDTKALAISDLIMIHTGIDLEAENKEIVSRYKKLLKVARPQFKDKEDAKLVRKAFNMALEAHKDIRRKSGEPYIYHPIAVAQICAEEIGLGTTSIISALLHDTVEDTDMELADIEREFGPKVAKIIDGLTKISGVFAYGSSQQAENFRKMLLTLTDDVRVILVKLADRLHNMRTLDSMSRTSQLKIASETIYLYAPLAHRLGLYVIKTELEDLYLKYAEPATYEDIKNKISQTKAARNKFIREFIAPIEEEMHRQGLKGVIKGRPKSIYSIYNKIKKNKVTFEEIYDLFAIRLILDADMEHEKSVCWQAYSIVTDFYTPNTTRLRDWISTPKSNGYESLHVTVMSGIGQWVEVQIRTTRMDEIAEKGYAAHWKYKENTAEKNRETGLEQWISKVRDMLATNDSSAIDFVNDFRNNLFADEVYVFTPKGDLRILPNGSTALDFAFDIHSHVGASCIGAKVNGRLVPISHKLGNGDQIEILTSTKQKPNEDWLKFVVSSKAVNKIKEALKEEKKLIANEGKEILERKLRTMKLEPTDELLLQMRSFFDLKTNYDLYYRIGKKLISVNDIRKFRDLKNQKHLSNKLVPTDSKQFEKEIKQVRTKDTDSLLIGEDMDRIDYTLAKCCNPIPGDQVFGFVTINEGIKIHRTTCPNAVELMSNYGYRIIKAKWTSQTEIAFLAGLRITGTDRMGLVNDVTKVISSELKVNMRSITIETNDGVFEGDILLFVHDTEQLESVINKLKRVKGIIGVNRYNFDQGNQRLA